MKCLLLGGAPSVGKSETIYRLTRNLLAKGFVVVSGTVPAVFADFRAVLEGVDKSQNKVRIIINSATDTEKIITDFKDFYDRNGKYDIFISSVRDDNFYPRSGFFIIMDLRRLATTILEIPMAKVTRQGVNFPVALNWYNAQLDNLLNHVISESPFNI
ncbi:MAG: hypothetical protein U0U67_05990 [Chitinophagales bacterium]